jgi:hypothetical protein
VPVPSVTISGPPEIIAVRTPSAMIPLMNAPEQTEHVGEFPGRRIDQPITVMAMLRRSETVIFLVLVARPSYQGALRQGIGHDRGRRASRLLCAVELIGRILVVQSPGTAH